MKIESVRCPVCNVQLELKVPDDIYESHVQGMNEGIVETLRGFLLSGIKIDSYVSFLRKTRDLKQELSEFLNEPLNIVQNHMELPEVELANKWAINKCSTEEFYINNETYLYDNAKYNLFVTYQVQRILPLVMQRNMKTLDFGCGIGSLVFMLSEQNNESWGYDINPIIIDFCNFRKKKYDSNAQFTTKKPDYSQFDLITALGTLEHIENLEDLIKEFRIMKSGSKLFHYDDWGDQNISPMHFDHSKNIERWLIESGFKPVNERWAIKV